MKTTAGLWIDHLNAVIAIVSPEGDKTMMIRSDAEQRQEQPSALRATILSQAEQISEDHSREQEFVDRLNRYYDKVIETLHNVESILIFGPGEAKGELLNRLERANPGGNIVALETEDKMTEHEIASELRTHFQ